MPLRFPDGREDSGAGWAFDLVGLLAIIGETAVDEVAQPLTASPLVLLPRLLPAPHAMIRPDRRATLPLNPDGVAVGVYSGNIRAAIPYFASVLHPIELAADFSVQVLDLKPKSGKRFQGFKTRTFAPLNALTVFGFLLTCGLLAGAGVLEDGCAVLSVLFVSLAGAATSLASLWHISFPNHRSAADVPNGDVVLYARNGAFILIRCEEDVARALYWTTQPCAYSVSEKTYQILISTGTILLMFGVVLMANCTWTMQVALGGSYLLLNALYLFAALSRNTVKRWLWDLSSVNLSKVQPRGRSPSPENSKNETPATNDIVPDDEKPTYQCSGYTEALWRVIFETRSVAWVRTARLTPQTDAWEQWLDAAEAAAKADNDQWDPLETFAQLLRRNRAAAAVETRMGSLQLSPPSIGVAPERQTSRDRSRSRHRHDESIAAARQGVEDQIRGQFDEKKEGKADGEDEDKYAGHPMGVKRRKTGRRM